MKPTDRARLIRDDLLAREMGWEKTRVGCKDVASLEFHNVSAVLWSQIRYEEAPNTSSHWLHDRPTRRASREDPYTLDVWIEGLRVLSITWNERDELTLLRMVRGLWECEFFELPLPTGRSSPTIH